LAIACAPLEATANVSTDLAPCSGKRPVLGKYITLQFKLVTVAGADQVLIEASAIAADSVGCTQRMRSFAPLSSTIVPLPDHTAAMSANGPDPANVAEPDTSSAANTPATTIRGRKDFKFGFVSIALAFRSFKWEAANAAEVKGKKDFAEAYERSK